MVLSASARRVVNRDPVVEAVVVRAAARKAVGTRVVAAPRNVRVAEGRAAENNAEPRHVETTGTAMGMAMAMAEAAGRPQPSPSQGHRRRFRMPVRVH